ncbi:MAG TPA: sigma-E factor negative regulatory protein [Steroidobacteraceae bacterium]|nr:sigma-E factor negative regulatory protein [Steroidobacteraceae bacterium]
MKQDEVDSQLSAMFDGELPAAECELLSRRLDRDENLRARWSRYALIGAAMRCEPVATARSDFAARVSCAVDRAAEGRGAGERRGGLRGRAGGAWASGAADAATAGARRRGLLWQSALAAALVVCVAGSSILMLRYVALGPAAGLAGVTALTAAPVASGAPAVLATPASEQLLARARQAAAVLGLGPATPAVPVAAGAPLPTDHEPWSYVTPPNDSGGGTPLRTELVDYIVAHSEYSTPLMRPDLLSALISGGGGEDDPDSVLPAAGAVHPDAAAGGVDARPAPAASR